MSRPSIKTQTFLPWTNLTTYTLWLTGLTTAEANAGLALTSSNYEEAIKLLRKQLATNNNKKISKHMDVLLQLEGVILSPSTKAYGTRYDTVEALDGSVSIAILLKQDSTRSLS